MRGSDTMLEWDTKTITRLAKVMETLVNKVTVIEYPEERRRSVDMVVECRDRENDDRSRNKVVIKVSEVVSNRKKDFVELKRITELLNVNALVIARFYNKEKLLDNVLYIRGRIGIVVPETIESLKKNEKVYIYEYQGSYYVKVKGEVLRELRSKMKLGYSMLARMLGITSKALYEYEQGKMSMSAEVAERFLELFGEEFEKALEAIDIFSFRIVGGMKKELGNIDAIEAQEDLLDEKNKILAKLRKLGIRNIERFERIPSDMVLNHRDLRVFIALAKGGSDPDKVAKKCRENAKLAHELDGKALTLIAGRDRDLEYVAEKYSDIVSRNIDDVIEIISRERA